MLESAGAVTRDWSNAGQAGPSRGAEQSGDHLDDLEKDEASVTESESSWSHRRSHGGAHEDVTDKKNTRRRTCHGVTKS